MVKKLLSILTCLIFLHSLPALSQTFEVYNTQNMPTSYNNINNDCTDYPSVSAMERNAFGRTFQYENIYQRIARLESNILGTTFPQEALCDRIDRITKAASGTNTYAYNSPMMQQSMLQNMANSFGNNSSCDNQYNTSSQNSTGLQKVLEFAIPIITGLAGSNYGYNNYAYGPGYMQDYNSFQNTGFGTGVKILP